MTQREIPENAKLIPVEARKVFEGILFDVYQWEQELFDGSYETFEMLKRPDTVLVIALDDNDQVIVMREQQSGAPVREARVPGGRVNETDTSTLAAIQREIHEETGITMREWKFIEAIQPEVKIEWFIHVFVARGIQSVDEPHTDPGEKIEVRRMPYEELRKVNFDSSRVRLFRDIKTTDELKALFN